MREARKIFEETSSDDYIAKRNAELAVFGTESKYANSKYIAEHGSMINSELPCELGVVEIGDTIIFALQGEIFVEYGIALKAEAAKHGKKGFVVEVTNGSLPGYIYTPESLAEGGYEVGNSAFSADAGDVVTSKLINLMNNVK